MVVEKICFGKRELGRLELGRQSHGMRSGLRRSKVVISAVDSQSRLA
jgi:hypothetical protein